MGRLRRLPENAREPAERDPLRRGPVAVAQPRPPERLGVGGRRQSHVPARELPLEEAPLDRRGVEHGHASGEHFEHAIERLLERWRVGEVGHAQLVHEHGPVL